MACKTLSFFAYTALLIFISASAFHLARSYWSAWTNFIWHMMILVWDGMELIFWLELEESFRVKRVNLSNNWSWKYNPLLYSSLSVHRILQGNVMSSLLSPAYNLNQLGYSKFNILSMGNQIFFLLCVSLTTIRQIFYNIILTDDLN